MGLFSGIKNLARTIRESTSRWANGSRIAAAGRTMAGVRVNPDEIVTISTVWAALRYVSQTVAVLPWHVIKKTDQGSEIQSDHPIDWMLNEHVSDEWSSFQFRETLTHWALRWGNGYAEIERDQAGRPFAMHPIHPERVTVCRDPETYKIYYEVDVGSGQKVELEPRDVFHIRGFGEGPVGVNVVNYAAQSLGWARAAQLFGAAFFGNGANVSGIVVHKKKLTEPGLKRVKHEFDQLFKGIKNSHGVVHVDTDADFKKLGLDAKETQLVEVHQFLVEEICRWFGVPPHKVMHLLRATFTNIEHQAIEVVVDSVNPWVKRFEVEANKKLFGKNRNGYKTHIEMRALMRGDVAARIAYYEGMVRIGAYSPNDVLRKEDENTIGPDGDIHVMQSQNVTLEQIKEGATLPKPAEPPAASPEPEDSKTPAARAAVDRIAALLETANV